MHNNIIVHSKCSETCVRFPASNLRIGSDMLFEEPTYSLPYDNVPKANHHVNLSTLRTFHDNSTDLCRRAVLQLQVFSNDIEYGERKCRNLNRNLFLLSYEKVGSRYYIFLTYFYY